MKPIDQTKNKEEVLDWISNKRRELDHETVLFIDSIHKKLTKIEIQARTRIATFRTGEGYSMSKKDYKRVLKDMTHKTGSVNK